MLALRALVPKDMVGAVEEKGEKVLKSIVMYTGNVAINKGRLHERSGVTTDKNTVPKFFEDLLAASKRTSVLKYIYIYIYIYIYLFIYEKIYRST